MQALMMPAGRNPWKVDPVPGGGHLISTGSWSCSQLAAASLLLHFVLVAPRLVLWIVCTSQMLMRWRVGWGVHILRGLQVRKPGWEHLQRGAHSGPWSQQHPLYRHKEVAAGVWWIEEKYFASSWNLANIYFIRGSEADLLIDTGVGVHQVINDLIIVKWS